MLTVSVLSSSATKFCASTSFIFSSMSTMFGCKVDEIFQCQDSTQAACSSGNSVVRESSSGYFLVKNLQTLLKIPHNSSDEKKRMMWKNHEELKEKLQKVMTNNLHLHNIFHQRSSLPYTGKENWLHFITKTIGNTTSSPYYTAGVAIPFVRNMWRSVSIPVLKE